MSIVNKLSNIKLDPGLKTPANTPKGAGFENALQGKSDAMVNGVNSFILEMRDAEAQMDKKLATLGDSQFKTLFELQRSMQGIHLTTEVLTKSGDAILGGVRRLQQMGAS